jgi:hypothetical protein
VPEHLHGDGGRRGGRVHGNAPLDGSQSLGLCLQLRVNRTPDRKRRAASSVILTALVLVAASLVGSAQAYACTSDADCQYPTCNDNICSSSSSYCGNGKWKAYCVSGT